MYCILSSGPLYKSLFKQRTEKADHVAFELLSACLREHLCQQRGGFRDAQRFGQQGLHSLSYAVERKDGILCFGDEEDAVPFLMHSHTRRLHPTSMFPA